MVIIDENVNIGYYRVYFCKNKVKFLNYKK